MKKLYNNVFLQDMAYVLPEESISSEQIEQELKDVYHKLNFPLDRLEFQTGIKSRGFWPNGTKPSLLSTEAAKKIFLKAPEFKEKLGLIIHSSVCRDFLEPATASQVHHHLGLSPDTLFMDVSNACLGFLQSMCLAAGQIESGEIEAALIVSGENGGPLLRETLRHLKSKTDLTRKEFKELMASLTIGSAAVAALLVHKDLATTTHQFFGAVGRSNTAVNELCEGDGNINGLMMKTDSEKLLQVGLGLAKETWDKAQDFFSWNKTGPQYVIGHQVGRVHEEQVLSLLDRKPDPRFNTYTEWGNTGSAALPLTLFMAEESGVLKKNDEIALLGIGSGLSCLVAGMKW